MRETLPRNLDETTPSYGAHEESVLAIGRQYATQILQIINDAKYCIDILMFHWAWYEKDLLCEVSQINQALVRAKGRGVKVRCFCDMLKSVNFIKKAGLDARVYKGKATMHAKLVHVDNKIAVMGSHNFSQNAMCFNKEISIVLRAPHHVVKLKAYFETLWRTSM